MNNDGVRLQVSYLTLRRVVGVLGVSLPVLLALGGFVLCSCIGLEESISHYYGTGMRNVLVGILFTIAWFLFSYRGYEPRDDWVGDLACFFALGVALFPTTSDECCSEEVHQLIRGIHFISATGLFLALAYFSLFLFTKVKKDGSMTREKARRNKLYVTCGVVILGCIALIPLYHLLPEENFLATIQPVFWLESLALWAFGVSWMTKGEMLWKDLEPT